MNPSFVQARDERLARIVAARDVARDELARQKAALTTATDPALRWSLQVDVKRLKKQLREAQRTYDVYF